MALRCECSLNPPIGLYCVPAIGLYCIAAQTPLGHCNCAQLGGQSITIYMLARSCYRAQHAMCLSASVNNGARVPGAKHMLHAHCLAIKRRLELPSLIVLPTAALAGGLLRSTLREWLSRRHWLLC